MRFFLHSLSQHIKQLSLIACIGLLSMVSFKASAQVNTLSEDFDVDSLGLTTSGWSIQNLSNPLGLFDWELTNNPPIPTPFPAFSTPGFIAASYQATDLTPNATISCWLITPEINFSAGDTLRFWTRNELSTWADRMQIRLSTNGGSINVGASETSVGDFTTLITDINAAQTIGGYPNVYTQIELVIPNGVCGSGRIAFRYFVEDVNNGVDDFADYIGVDEFRFNHTNTPQIASLTANQGVLCAGEQDTLTATGTGSFEWYDQAVGGTLLATTASGAPFYTGVLTDTTKFYVQSNILGCTTARDSVEIIVNPIPDVNSVANQEVCNGSLTTLISFSGAVLGAQYNWTNNTPSIGITSGTGDISPFTAVNATNVSVVSTVTVTPEASGCIGTPITFDITVGPNITVDTVANQVVCNGSPTTAVNFSGSVSGTVFNWINNTPSIGLADSGSGNIGSFVAVNTGNAPVTATITVTPETSGNLIPELLYYKFNGSGTSVPNLASTPPPGTATATIMGSLSQGGSAICDGTLIGSGNASSTDFLNTGWAPNLGTSSWTISFKSENIAPSATLYYVFGDVNTNSFRCFTNGVAGPNNWLLRGAGLTDVALPGGATTAPHTNTFVYDNTLNQVRAYLDGVLVNTVAQGAVNVSGAGPFKVNGYSTNVGSPLNGHYDEFSFFNRALTASEVLELVPCSSGPACAGTPETFDITVNPTPTVDPVANQEVCFGAQTSVSFSGAVSGTVYNWTNSDPSIGLAASGTGDIASFTPINNTALPVVSTITVTPSYTNAGVTCTGTPVVFTITATPELTASAVATPALCFAGFSGTASVTPSGGTPAYTYLWSTGGTTSSISSLNAGSYSVIVTDANGCTAVDTTVVTQPSFFNVSAMTSNVSCNGGNDGSITVNVTGATPPYTYSWTSGGTSATESGLSAGTYTVTITDTNGCFVQSTQTVTEPTLLVLTPSSTAVLCNGGATGSASVVPSGGTGPYNYLWSTGSTASSISGQAAGTYSVTVTDQEGCSQNININITEPAQLTATILTDNVNCFGGSDGSAKAVPAGGVGPYTYLWSNLAITDSIGGLLPGAYSVDITDVNGCSITENFSITEPSLPLTTTTSATDALCNGAGSGTANVVPNGGTAPYTYSWSSGGTADTETGLSAGTYYVTVTDANGCTANDSATIGQPTPFVVVPSQTNVDCFGNSTGTASVNVSGATPPYTYEWDPSLNTGSTEIGLTAGNYFVTITDANGCETIQNFTITEPTQLVADSVSQVNVTCFGGNNGSATVIGTGGTAPYTYLWSNGQTTATAVGLVADTYTVEVTDSNGCKDSQIYTITEPDLIVTSILSQTNVSCFGDSTGTATIDVTGGTPGYTYLWSPFGGTAATASGLPAGVYTVAVQDVNGCTPVASQTVTITEPLAPLAGNPSQTNVTCNGFNDGTATVNPTGGTAPYTYLWSDASTSNSITNLAPGIYSVDITDNLGCTTSESFTITEPTLLVVDSTAQINVSCFDGNNGSATVYISGGTTPYTYLWSTGGTAATESGLTAGSHSVTVTDDNGCTLIENFIITEPTLLTSTASITSNYNGQQISCFGAADGSANVVAGGGTAPYTYLWSNGQTTTSISGLIAGTYSVTITDSLGCTATDSVTLVQPTELQASFGSQTNVSCNGGNDGSATVSVTGGTGIYSYSWSPSGGTSATESNLTAGTYTVTVTDINGCTDTLSFFITEPTVLTSTASQSNVDCNGNSTGTATITPAGGTAPYTYLWSDGQTTQTATGLAAGNYSVVATDDNGCTTGQSYTITQPAVLVITPSQTNVTCNGGNNGDATATPSGGTAPYTYLWASGETTATISGLIAGTYSVTVTDDSGCTAIQSYTITQPTPFVVIPSQTDVSCYGGSNGIATVSVSGNTAPYTYSWAPTGGTNPTAAGLIAGSYTVTITDFNLCQTTQNFTITEPNQFVVTPSSTNVTCFGGSDGTASVGVTGGTAPYSYLWSDGQTGPNATGLIAGAYSVTITDTNGCQITENITINQPSDFSVITASGNVSCFGGNNGFASVSVSGATPGYTYLWSPNGETTASINNLIAGAYSVTITDSVGCTTVENFTITEPPVLAVIMSSTPVSCNGLSDGTATAAVSGGTLPYTYLWSDGQTTSTASNLIAGLYTVNITDGNGCTLSDTISVTQPNVLALLETITNVSCFGGNDGSIDVKVSGGTMPYSYLWSDGQTTQTASGLIAGTYSVTVTDFNGCTVSGTYTVTEPPVLVASNGGQINVSCNGLSDGSATVSVTGGTPGYTYSWTSGGTAATETGLSAGSYTVTVTDSNGCTDTETFIITEPAILVASNGGQTNVSCFGGNNGSATVSVTGGTTPYTYLWSDGQTTQTATGLIAGSYMVTVTDFNGCTTTQNFIITEPTLLVASNGGQTNLLCFGDANGTATVTASGGTPGYSYSWSNGQTGATATGLVAGTYIATVTDTLGCTATQSFTITEPPLLVANMFQNSVTCNGGNNGVAGVVATGGTPGYTYLWNTGSTNPTIIALATGTYTVTVTDANGCTATDSILVTQPTPFNVTAASTNVTCNAGTNGTASVIVSGSTPPYTYDWTGSPAGDGTPSVTGLAAGAYTVMITDANGCITSQNFTITEPTPLVLVPSQTNVDCNGNPTGSASASVSGGTPPYTYLWSNGATTASISGLTAGTYSVTATDLYGCTIFQSYTITEPAVLSATTQVTSNYNGQDISCNGASDGSVSTTPSGGTAPYTYLWSTGDVTASVSGLPAGTYNVTITDDNGCTFSDAVTLTEPALLSASASQTNMDCAGNANGESTVIVSGGTTPYSYLWSDGQITATAVGLVAGNYTVDITDVNGCTTSAAVSISEYPVYAGLTQVNVICQGDSVVFGGVAYNATGLYPFTFTTVNGCDSTVTLDLTVNPVYAGLTQVTTICSGDIYTFGGVDYTSAGLYVHTFSTINGCDSTVTLFLYVNPISSSSHTAVACDSYTFNGIPYVATGVYTQNYTNVYGCDSTVTLNLTINSSYNHVQNSEICDGDVIAFGSNLYSVAGSYPYIFQSVQGCDSTVTLNLTVHPVYSGGTQTETICDGDVFVFGGIPYGVAGSYPHTFSTINGCDSTVTLILNVNPSYAGLAQNSAICQGDSILFGGTYYNSTGSYTHTFPTVNGCDSTVTLNLIVNPVYAGGIQNTIICSGTTINFGGTLYGTPGAYTHTFTTINGCDSTVTMNLIVNPTSLTSLTATSCVNYTLNGVLYTSSGTYNQMFTNIHGCDSTVTLNLTINPAFAGGTQNETICQGSGFTFGGSLYTTSGSYTHNFHTVNGCDSIVTLNLTVNPSYSGGIQNTTICQGQSVTFGGTVYTTSGSYTHTFSTINGCDSTATLVLVVNPTYAGGVQNNTICQGQSVTFGGTVYTTTGSYIHTFQTVNGCDSTVTLNLTVNPTYVGGIQNSSICLGDNINFGGTLYTTAGTYIHTFQTVNGCDSTVTMNLTVRPTTSSSITTTACTSYTLNGTTYNASGVYTQLHTNVFGCDSVLTLNLTIAPTYTGTQNSVICQGNAFSFGGSTYTTSGSYPHMFHTIYGCDSLVTLNLTVNPVYSGGIQTAVICQGQSITFGGMVYNTTGLYPHTFQTVNGCDSTVTLNLTVNPTYAGGVQNSVICQGQNILFGGTTYTTAGSYTHTFSTVNGCDSTVTMNLTVNPTYTGVQNSIICQGSSITFGGTVYNTAGSYTHVFQTINGCDSTITMNLSVNPVSNTSLSAVACNSYTLNNQTYTASGTYTQAFTNVYGCDSTVTLSLVIHPSTSGTITQTACGSYTINGQTFTQSGTYIQMFTNQYGCDSTLTLNLTINHVDVGVTQNGNVLSANLTGATYQWIDCSTGLPILNETYTVLYAKENGSYAVVITDGACTDTSDCFTVYNAGINDFTDIDVNVFPNPNEGEFTVQLGGVFAEIQIELYDMNGKLIMRRQWFNTDMIQISEVLASGVYQVRVKAGDFNTVKTIIRK